MKKKKKDSSTVQEKLLFSFLSLRLSLCMKERTSLSPSYLFLFTFPVFSGLSVTLLACLLASVWWRASRFCLRRTTPGRSLPPQLDRNFSERCRRERTGDSTRAHSPLVLLLGRVSRTDSPSQRSTKKRTKRTAYQNSTIHPCMYIFISLSSSLPCPLIT